MKNKSLGFTLTALAFLIATDASAQCVYETTLRHPLQVVPTPSQGFGDYLGWYDGTYYNGHHAGIDLPASPGTPVYAPASGLIEKARGLGSIGGIVIIRHYGQFAVPSVTKSNYRHAATTESSLLTTLIHIDPIVQEGTCVAKGQQIGRISSISRPHLHWETGTSSQQRSPSGSLFGRQSNRTPAGYYVSAQLMTDDGGRDASLVLTANISAPNNASGLTYEQRADQLLQKCATAQGLSPYVNGLGNR